MISASSELLVEYSKNNYKLPDDILVACGFIDNGQPKAVIRIVNLELKEIELQFDQNWDPIKLVELGDRNKHSACSKQMVGLEDRSLENVPHNHHLLVQQILADYADIFSQIPGGFGRTNVTHHQIDGCTCTCTCTRIFVNQTTSS